MKQYRIKKEVEKGKVKYHPQVLRVWFWGLITFWETIQNHMFYNGYNDEYYAREVIREECADMNYKEIIPVDKPCHNHLEKPTPPGSTKPGPPPKQIKEGKSL